MLDWKNSQLQQEKGVELAMTIKNVSIFLQPCTKRHNKNVWENCAKVISQKDNTALSPYLINMFEWLQDMNWPGADIIYAKLQSMSSDSINDAYNYCLNVAIQTNDIVWKDVLETFSSEKTDMR